MARPTRLSALALPGLAAALLLMPRVSPAIDRMELRIERIETAAGVLKDARLKVSIDPKTAAPRGNLSIGSTPVGPLSMNLALRETGGQGLIFTGDQFSFAGGDVGFSASLIGQRWTFTVDASAISGQSLLELSRPFIDVPDGFSAQGRLDTLLQLAGRTDTLLPEIANLEFRGADLGFSNAEGTFAAEGIDLETRLGLSSDTSGKIEVSGYLKSERGEALFDNAYLKLGSYPTRIGFEGAMDANRLSIGLLEIKQEGLVAATASANLLLPGNFRDAPVDVRQVKVESATLDLEDLRFPAVYTSYLQTSLAGTSLDALESSGRISGTLQIRDNAPVSGELKLEDLSLRDSKGLFFLDRLRGAISWVPEDREPLEPSVLAWDAGGIYDVRGGASSLRLVLRGMSAAVLEPVRLPVFDGAVNIQELRMKDAGSPNMQVQFTGEIEPISMSEISRAFGWPELGGFVTGRIPRVEYKDDTLIFGGDLEAEIFDGLVRGSNIKLSDPLGRWPRLSADLTIDNLDLETLTSTLEFGAITGRIDGQVDNLELFAWAPVSFDAWLRTPEDDHSRKRISVDAINSIANVGGSAGSGVASALQMGALRFFSRYSYRQLAVRCVLEDDVCRLSGAPIANNRYYLLEGAGVPRVDIIGNSGRIQWSELLRQIAWQIETGGTFSVQ
jgi:hypothetical protein